MQLCNATTNQTNKRQKIACLLKYVYAPEPKSKRTTKPRLPITSLLKNPISTEMSATITPDAGDEENRRKEK
jgi:hypothetical protein